MVMKAIKNMSLWGWMIVFTAIVLWPGQGLCVERRSQENKAITGKQFVDELVNQRKNGPYTPKAREVKGEMVLKSKVVSRAVKISNVIFEGDINICDTTFIQALSFQKCTFKSHVSVMFSNFLQVVRFEDCVFEDKFTFNDNLIGKELQGRTEAQGMSTFAGCTFKKNLSLLCSEFFTPVDFLNCRFCGNAFFGDYPRDEFQAFVEGKQDNERKKATFKQPVYFSGSIFERKAFFPYTEFSGVSFSETVFEGPARFSKTKFQGNSDFSRAIFESKADFERAIFYQNQSIADQAGEAADTANFYKVSFKDDVSFSKSIFLTNVDFKRASFGQRALFTNTLFAMRANFEMCFFGKELFGSKINELERIKRELCFYKLNESWKDQHRSSEEPAGFNEDWHTQVSVWEKISREKKIKVTAEVRKEIGTYLQEKFGDPEKSNSVFLDPKKDLKDLIESWQGKEAYIGPSSFEIIDAGNLSCEQNQFFFTGSRFGGEVDFRGGRFNEADFTSGETMTVFHETADFSDVSFQKLCLNGTVFLGKVYLPLEKLFSETGMVSRSFTIDDLILPLKRGLRKEGDRLHGDPESLKELYTQLEPLFRKNFQILEANEMALRAAWLRFKLWDRQDKLASLFTLIALPIRNLWVITVAFNLYFYVCLVVKGSIKARTRESCFKPGKVPLVLVSSEDLSDAAIDHVQTPEGKKTIVRIRWWQEFSWPLFLCLGTFFAIVSLGSEYVTDDPRCLTKMKILRIAGFVLLPLFVYSLAKRSEGLHALATFI